MSCKPAPSLRPHQTWTSRARGASGLRFRHSAAHSPSSLAFASSVLARRTMLVLVLTLAAVAVTAFVVRRWWAAAPAPEQHNASKPSSIPSSRVPGKALAEAIVRANYGLSSEEVWSRPAIEPSTAIAGFPAHPSIACFACFEAEHRLNKGVVRKLYTNEDVPATFPEHRAPKQSSCLSHMRLSPRASSSSSTSRSPQQSAGRAGWWPSSTRRCGRGRGGTLGGMVGSG